MKKHIQQEKVSISIKLSMNFPVLAWHALHLMWHKTYKTHRQLNRIHINFKQKTKNGIVSLIVRDVCIKTLQHDIFQEHTWLLLSIFYDKNILHYLWTTLNENVRVELLSKYT